MTNSNLAVLFMVKVKFFYEPRGHVIYDEKQVYDFILIHYIKGLLQKTLKLD